VDAVVAIVSAVVPDPVTEVGVKTGVVPAGAPVTLKLTEPAKPF
jgi:hypothetical protein